MVAKKIEMEDITVAKNGWRVTLSYTGEGYAGSYIKGRDPKCKDLLDDPLVRFTVYQRINGAYMPVKHGSQLTFLRPTDKQNVLIDGARLILDEVIAYDGSLPPDMFYKKLAKIHLYNGKARMLPSYGSPSELDD